SGQRAGGQQERQQPRQAQAPGDVEGAHRAAPRPAAGSSQPCIFIHAAKASNQPVLVVGLGYMPKPGPPCSESWNPNGRPAACRLSTWPKPQPPNRPT